MLETADVRQQMARIEQFRQHTGARMYSTERFIGAVAGAVERKDAMKFAHENGLYVIVQSGEAVEIVPVPEVFQAKEW